MTLKLHHLRPAPGAKTAKTRVGRGEGSKGKTAGRGTKGTKARYQVPAHFEGGQLPLHMRLPKLKGFKNPFRVEFQVVNLDRLGELYPEGGDVSVDDLVAKGAVRKGQPVKILGQGDIAVACQVNVQAYSASAKAEDRGGRRHCHGGMTCARRGPRTTYARRPAPSLVPALSALSAKAVCWQAPVRLPAVFADVCEGRCRRSDGVTNRSRARGARPGKRMQCSALM